MPKLVRQALTAAVLIALAVRLRRRSRLPRPLPAPPPPPPPAPRRGHGKALLAGSAVLAVAVALVVAVALTGGPAPQGATATGSATPVQAPATASPGGSSPGAAQPAPTMPTTPAPDPACTPPRHRVVDARAVDPATRRAVNRQWQRIERWLKTHAPRSHGLLGAPGRARTIAVAEAQTGVDYPDDLRASLLRHNGSAGLSALGFWEGGARHLGIRQIRDAWRAMCARGGAAGGWNGLMIPVFRLGAAAPGTLPYVVVDSRDGTVGWDDGVTGTAPRMASTYTMLRRVADALERGTPIAGRRPVAVRGVLRWTPVD
ncbi:hypothetical protein [Nonomuraea pusilla]|uniref:Knr4/Smi1-like domain-containing protein n=1 Tax=Nonomuraea pusilla TaxID=46177 RepID=A0A1H7N736_9ACTN|nr:hypothetical protein [Nonomuraea pusilla]SEL19323.1 hypothetical protein SAMN05660976_01936 [Nonomuraea pusilla]